jgi:phenylpyruvate tautomerase PptA (4-oxalocrotonate tautomerase family)
MPNVKIFVDEAVLRPQRARIQALIGELDKVLIDKLGADRKQVHIMFVPAVTGTSMAGVYVDLNYKPHSERTPQRVQSACQAIAELIGEALESDCRIRANSQDLSSTTAVDIAMPKPLGWHASAYLP